ncbi:hypothetical protein BJ912DRAFT_179852 [Pholiota molesta]|nr:hypothetical protein BJ912DRAFT_179852 [Pholiota molesta]
MSTSGQPWDAPHIPAITVAEIKTWAMEDISKEARGLVAITLIKTARAQILSAREQEGKGNLRAAFASYIKAATLTKMALDSPEYIQDAQDKGTGVIQMELADFFQNDGRDIGTQTKDVEEKLKAIENAQTASTVVLSSVPYIDKSRKEKAEREEQERKGAEARERRGARAREKRDAARETAKKHQEQMNIRRQKEAAAIEQYIVSESSLIACSAGMNIQRVVSGFELCRITIKNLPNDTKLEEIADIFTQQGVDSSDFFILQLRPNGGKREAVVVVNVDQVQNITVGLEGIEFRDDHLTFEVSENASWNGMSTATQNTPFLTVSWWAPSETIIATYDSVEKAREHAQRLNGKTWNGRRIKAMLNDRRNGASGFMTFVEKEIKILGCPPGTAHNSAFYAFVETFYIRSLSSANYNLDEVFTSVRNHLRHLPGVQMHTHELLNNGYEVDAEARIKIRFDTWEDAKQAHKTMDKKRLKSNFPFLRSWLPKLLQYSIKIPRQQYQAQKAQWDELSDRTSDRDARVHTSMGDRGDVFIRVVGQDKKAAGLLKVRVERMVAGEKLDAAHWHPSFASPRGKIFLARVLDETKVYVRSDFKTRRLRVCGEPARVKQAKQMIREEVERLAGMETTRILDAACVRGFMREGLGKLKELIGGDNVAVNVASVPYKVTVKGGVEATHHLQRLMDESRAMGAPDNTRPGDAEREICPICTDDVSNPEQLGCGHTYCSGCLSHFLTSAEDTKNFPLVCMGNGGQCRVPIAMPFIRRFLPQQLFENLVEAAFMAYLEQHPQELKYCTTPDCKQIYRRRTDKALLKCPACFSTICPMCDEEAHEGITCEERNFYLNPRLQQRLNDRLAREQAVKKCPQCNVFIERIEGCNLVMCKCGAHICCLCWRLFTAGTIYPHFNVVHDGNVYGPVPGGATH